MNAAGNDPNTPLHHRISTWSRSTTHPARADIPYDEPKERATNGGIVIIEMRPPRRPPHRRRSLPKLRTQPHSECFGNDSADGALRGRQHAHSQRSDGPAAISFDSPVRLGHVEGMSWDFEDVSRNASWTSISEPSYTSMCNKSIDSLNASGQSPSTREASFRGPRWSGWPFAKKS
ncbi:hypothetical protein EV126DRAFT_439994 [Verticillium dahliae]|nr:hypothetical protein EV126DRAFT_439994 [Verticillium dahliae]